MAIMTEELRVAVRNFKSSINSFNFVINHEEPPFPIGSMESYKAQLALANEYLERYPALNSEEFNTIGFPLYIKAQVTRKIEQKSMLEASSTNTASVSVSELLWDAYMIMDHGSHDERLAMLDKLEKHFDTFGKPNSR